MVIRCSRWSSQMEFTLSSMSVSLARLPRGSRLKDAQGLFQNLQAFVFGAIEEDVLAQHPANQKAAACPKEADAARQSQTHVWVKFLDIHVKVFLLGHLFNTKEQCCSTVNLLSCLRGLVCFKGVAARKRPTPMF